METSFPGFQNCLYTVRDDAQNSMNNVPTKKGNMALSFTPFYQLVIIVDIGKESLPFRCRFVSLACVSFERLARAECAYRA